MSNEYETWKAYAENLQAQRENDAATIDELAEALDRQTARLIEREAELREACQERDHFRAVLEGARYPNLDNLKDRPYAQCRQIGEVVAEMTKAIIDEHTAYKKHLAEALKILVLIDPWSCDSRELAERAEALFAKLGQEGL